MTRHGRQWARGRRARGGNAIIEMALVFPVLIYLGLGMVEFGQFFYVKNAFQQAARDAGRAAIMPGADQPDPYTAARATLAAAGITFQNAWLTITDITPGGFGSAFGSTNVTDCSTVTTGHAMTVTVTTTYMNLPGSVRPLYSTTGTGIGNGRTVAGQCLVLKE